MSPFLPPSTLLPPPLPPTTTATTTTTTSVLLLPPSFPYVCVLLLFIWTRRSWERILVRLSHVPPSSIHPSIHPRYPFFSIPPLEDRRAPWSTKASVARATCPFFPQKIHAPQMRCWRGKGSGSSPRWGWSQRMWTNEPPAPNRIKGLNLDRLEHHLLLLSLQKSNSLIHIHSLNSLNSQKWNQLNHSATNSAKSSVSSPKR